MQTPTKTIGFILPTPSNRFEQKLMEFLENALSEIGYHLSISLTNHQIEKEKHYLKYMADTTDGILIISDAEQYEMIADAVPSDIPTVFLNRKPMGCPHTAIIENNYSAVFQAIFALINDGHENVACICRNPDFSTTKEVIQAYRNAMENSPAGFHEEWIHFFDWNEMDLPHFIDTLTAKGCNAFFTASQTLTEHFLDYLFLHNAQGNQVALAGFSNVEHNNTLQQSIDMVNQPIKSIADLAAQQIVYLINNPQTEPRDYIIKGIFRKRNYEPFSTKMKHEPDGETL